MSLGYELGAAALAVTHNNGFEKCTWQNLPVKVMMTITEVDELREELEKGDVIEMGFELADIYIRLSGILIDTFPTEWAQEGLDCGLAYGRTKTLTDPHVAITLADLVTPMNGYALHMQRLLSRAVEAWRKDRVATAWRYLTEATHLTVSTGRDWGYDLADLIEKKIEKNASRGRFHGKANGAG